MSAVTFPSLDTFHSRYFGVFFVREGGGDALSGFAYKPRISVAILQSSSGDGFDVANKAKSGYPHFFNSISHRARSKPSSSWNRLWQRVWKSGRWDESRFQSRAEN